MEFKRTQFPQLRFRTPKELGAGKLLQKNSLTCNSTGFTSLNTIYFFVILMKSSFKRWLGNQFFVATYVFAVWHQSTCVFGKLYQIALQM